MTMKTSAAVIISAIACISRQTNAFVPSSPRNFVQSSIVGGSSNTVAAPALHLNIPRLPLPDAVGVKLGEFDLKNPNDMSTEEYNSYSGAAIGGTLLFFLLPGAFLTGIFGDLGELGFGLLADFAFSATVGGGLAIYLSLREDEIGETVRENGLKLYAKIKDLGLPVVPRQTVPDAITEKLVEFDLLSINGMTDEEYDGYSGAAVAGTLLFFLLPGLLVSGLGETLSSELLPQLVLDFVFSALIGGGSAIYLSLRKDEIGDTVNQYGASLLSAVDNIIGGDD